MSSRVYPENLNVIYLKNFITDYYLTKIEIKDKIIKMSRVKKLFNIERKSRTLTIQKSDIPEFIIMNEVDYALMIYRRYNFNYENQRREKILKNNKKNEKYIIPLVVGMTALIILL